MKNIAFVTYTHTNCKDVWIPYFNSLDRHAPTINSYVMSDRFDASSVKFVDHLFLDYDDSANYCSEFVKVLNDIDEEYFIYMQEDFILYDDINMNKIEEYTHFLETSDMSFVRLIKCGDVTDDPVSPGLFLIKESRARHASINSFSMQPTIWKKKDFIRLYNEAMEQKFGERYSYTDAMNKLIIDGVYAYHGEKKRGGAHYDSSVFPYVATAIVKGKWNVSEYPSELEKILSDNNIDVSIRGTT